MRSRQNVIELYCCCCVDLALNTQRQSFFNELVISFSWYDGFFKRVCWFITALCSRLAVKCLQPAHSFKQKFSVFASCFIAYWSNKNWQLLGVIANDNWNHDVCMQLTDPSIHCADTTRFYRLNLGTDGMNMFFNVHECNQFCKQLNIAQIRP